jgi:hypothetical protein
MKAMRIGMGGRATFGILVALALFCGWYAVAADYDYGALAGTYVWAGNGAKCTLKLAPDHTFSEEIDYFGNRQIVQGQWHRYGESHVSFSNQFIKLPGEELNAAGEAHGQFERTLGIFPLLVLAPLPGGPTLHRHLFR